MDDEEQQRCDLIWIVYTTSFLIMMEWVFFATKISFLSGLAWQAKLYALVIPIAAVALPLWIITIFLRTLYRGARLSISRGILAFLIRLFPSSLLALSFFLMADNFSYTVFKIGVFTFVDDWRYACAAFFLILVVFSARLIIGVEREIIARHPLAHAVLASLVIFAGSSAFAIKFVAAAPKIQPVIAPALQNRKAPNVILLGIDGLRADHMSAYGYARDTTPFLREFSKQMLVFENGFANSNRSGGSIMTLLTGKLPTTTRVIGYPDLLSAKDAFEHLPGLLRSRGYYNVEMGARDYADAFDLNMRHAFHEANYRDLTSVPYALFSSYENLHASLEFHFLLLLYERISDRLLHAFGAKTVTRYFHYLTKGGNRHFGLDSGHIDVTLDTIEKSEAPVFAHLHLLTTHGPTYYPQRLTFSVDASQNEKNRWDLYDDAIVDADNFVSEIVSRLTAIGELERTLLVIYSDHGPENEINMRLPLMFYLPTLNTARRVNLNAQLTDVAPTVLEALQIPVPDWLEGASLLSPSPVALQLRPIISAANQESVSPANFKRAPFYNLHTLAAAICHKKYELILGTNSLSSAAIEGYGAPCDERQMPSQDDVKKLLVAHLAARGYEVASLR